MRTFTLALLLALTGLVPPVLAQELLPLITYGPEAPTIEGDDNYRQVLYFQVPDTLSDSLYVHLFDPETGGAVDALTGAPDTQTRYTLYGGDGAFRVPSTDASGSVDESLAAGAVLREAVFGVAPDRDDRWRAFAAVAPADGDAVEGTYVFRLVVEGLSGNDGNVFDATLSLSSSGIDPPDGLKTFTFAPTFRLAQRGIFAIMRFDVPAGARQVVVHNYDVARAAVSLETLVRAAALTPSDQGDWATTPVQLDPVEAGNSAAITMSGDGDEFPNDATFYVTAGGRVLPILLPITVQQLASRPTVRVDAQPLSDCSSVAFDASVQGSGNQGLLQYTWTFSDGERVSGPSVVQAFDTPGLYRATVMVTQRSGQVGAGAVGSVEALVKDAPTAEAGPDLLVMPGEPVTFSGAAATGSGFSIARYLWDFNDGGTAQGQTVEHTFQAPGRYLVTLRAEDDAVHPCNFGTDQLEVRVNAPPIAEAGENLRVSVGEPLTLDGRRSYDTDGDIVAYAWDLGDGSTLDGASGEYAYRAPGRYTVTLTVRDDTDLGNNSAVDRIVVDVNDPPVAEAGSDQTAAVGEVLTFDATGSRDNDGTLIDYHWNFGDGGIGLDRQVTYAYRRSGTFQVTLTVRDNSGLSSGIGTDSLTVFVNAPPVAEAGPDQLVTESEVRFDATSSLDPDGQIATYAWDFGDGGTGAGPSPTHVYRRPGTYRVRLTVTDDSGTIRNEQMDEMTVVVNAAPIADAGPDQIGVPGAPLTFDGRASTDPDGLVSDYRWDFGDGRTAGGSVVSHAYDAPGTYAVTLLVTDDTGQSRALDHDVATVFINAPPVADAGPDLRVAPGQAVSLSARGSFDIDGTIAAYRWEFSDNAPPVDAPEVSRTFDAPGLYTARLNVTDDSGAPNASGRDQTTILVNHMPEARPGTAVLTCESTIRFDGTASADADGDGLTYRWDFGDGSEPASGPLPSHTYAEGGSYPVILRVDDGTGLANARDSADVLVTINRPPLAVAGADTTVCAGDVVLFDGTNSYDPEGGLLKYEWNFGDETVAEGVNPTKIYKIGGSYGVQLTVKDESGLTCNQDVDQLVVRVAESPIANAGEDQRVCANMPVQFDGSESYDADGIVNRFTWDFGDGVTGGGVAPTHIYTEPGTYRALLTIQGDQIGNCDNEDSDEVDIVVIAAPAAVIDAPASAPAGAPVRFDGSGSASADAPVVSWMWDFGDGETAEGAQVTHTYAEAGRYRVTLTIGTEATDTACSAVSAMQVIVVNEPPVADAGGDRLVAPNEEVVFDGSRSRDADGSISSFAWDFADGGTSEGLVALYRFAEAGRYPVRLTVSDDARLPNSTDVDTAWTTVNAAPVPVIDVDDPVCPLEPTAFSGADSRDADGRIVSYAWTFGDGAEADSADVTHTYEDPGRYHVTLRVDDGTDVANHLGETARTVVVNHAPRAVAGPDRAACPGVEVAFDGSGSIDWDGNLTGYRWTFGDGQSAEGADVSHAFARPGTYDVRLDVTDDSGATCGTTADTVRVRVNAPPVADAGGDRQAFVGGAHDAVLFDASGSQDADGDPLRFTWDFGDGQSDTGARVAHAYAAPGTYTVRLTVADDSGVPCGTVTDEVTVVVSARAAASNP